MIEKSKLEEMSSELPERERKDLLAKITRSLDREEREEVERVELKQEERERIITEEMDQLSPWSRFVIWLRSLFTGRSKRELFITAKIRQLKRSIKQKDSGISGFETRNVTPKFARQIYDLFAAAFALRDLFAVFTKDEEFRNTALNHLVEGKYAEAKKNLEELVPMEEMENTLAGGNEEEVRKVVLRKLTDYLKKIPDKMFQQIEEGLKPLIFLRNLVLFPFSLLFRHFNYYPGERLDDKYPYFDHAPVMLLLDLLERLYAAVSLAVKLGVEWFCHEELLRFYCLYRRKPAEGEAPAPGAQEIEQEAAELNKALVLLVDSAVQFDRRVPTLDLLRYFRKDPYLRLAFATPHLMVRPLYTAAVRARFLGQFEEKIASVKKNVVDRRIREIFKTEQLLELFYYNDRPTFDFRKLGLPYFSYTKSLMVLYNYLSKMYKGFIQEAVQTANSYVFAGNRIVQSRLLQSAGGLEELEARIVLLDRSLSPEEEDGKTLLQFRNRISADLTQQKLYRSFVMQKDKEARDLLSQGVEYLQSIRRHFEEIVASPVESVKAVLKTLHFYRGKNQTLSALLKATADLIGEFLDLLNQLLALEKGS